MARSLQLYQVFYRLHSEPSDRSRFCLAFSSCHATQVLIRSLVADGIELNTFDVGYSFFIPSYR